jgi:rod shape determining protein RodA
MSQWTRVWSRTDTSVLLAWLTLMAMGLAALYSCTVDFHAADQVVPSTVARSVFLGQLLWVGLGLLAAIACSVVPFRHYDTLAYLLYAAAILLLLMVVFFGKEVGGGRRWLSLAGLTLQPSELAKLGLVLALARFLAAHRGRSPWILVLGTAGFVLPVFALVAQQPDLGTALVFPALAVPMLFWAGVRLTFLVALASPAISALVMFYSDRILEVPSVYPWVAYILILLGLLYYLRLYLLPSMLLALANIVVGLVIQVVFNRLQPYQQARILTFFDPSESDRLSYGYQTFQSKVAIGSGGLVGKGFLAGTQKGLAFLPERHTDFIFSVVGEEFGLVGTWLVLGLFYFILYRAFRSATVVRRPFGSLLLIGVASYFTFQVLVNVSITVGLLPVTGLPLPFFSQGGSSMLASCLMMGLYFNVSSRWSEV